MALGWVALNSYNNSHSFAFSPSTISKAEIHRSSVVYWLLPVMIPYQLGSVTGDGMWLAPDSVNGKVVFVGNVMQAVKVPNGQKGPQEGRWYCLLLPNYPHVLQNCRYLVLWSLSSVKMAGRCLHVIAWCIHILLDFDFTYSVFTVSDRTWLIRTAVYSVVRGTSFWTPSQTR